MKYLKQIPKGWNEVKVKDYLNLSQLIDGDSESTDIIQAAFYVFTGVPMVDSKIKVEEVNAVVQRLLFISDVPTEGKTKLKVKNVKELTYTEYISFQKLAEHPMTNLIPIVQAFTKEPINEDTLTMTDAMGVFFLLHRTIKKRLIYLAICIMLKLMKLKVKTLFKKILNPFKMSSTKNGVR